MGNAKLKDDFDGGDDAFADELAPGAELMHGQYKIENFLNAGGFGITYSARDSLDRRVVIKECFPGAFCRRSTALVQARSRAHQSELASIVRLFVQEARSLAKLNHPNIVGVHQVFEENNTAYMALDFIEGQDLLAIIEEDKEALSPDDIESILRKVLDAVGFIHDQGILHRDISPDNILINDEGEPVLIDFGAAREEATKQSRVLSALRVVKDGYSPQEFYIAGSEQGPYSDLYALGATFYHLITGELPPNSQARLSAVASGESDPYTPLAGRIKGFKTNVLESVDQALAILPKDRIASAQSWIDLMDGKTPVKAVLATPVGTPKAEPAAAPAEPKSRKGLLLATVAVIGIAAVGVLTQTDVMSTGGVEETTAPAVEAPVPVISEAAPVVVPEDTASVAAEEPIVASEETAPVVISSDPEASAEITAGPVEFAGARAADEDQLFSQSIPVADVPVQPEPAAPSVDVTTDVENLLAPAVDPTELAIAEALQDSLPQPAEPAQSVTELSANVVLQEDPLPVIADVSRIDAPRAAIEFVAPQPQGTPVSADLTVPNVPLAKPDMGLSKEWSVVLPFSGLFSGRDGETRIFAVNNVPVSSLQEFNAAVADTVSDVDGNEVTLSVTVGTSGNDLNAVEWSLPIVQETRLGNGLVFQTKLENNSWVTRVAELPSGYDQNLQADDIIFGYIETSQILKERDDLYNILESELAVGKTQFNFAVKRGDSTWVVSFDYDPKSISTN